MGWHMRISKVAVNGGGTMGNGIAHVFAQSGRDVLLVDVDDTRLDTALKTIRSNFERQVKKGTLQQVDADGALARIRGTTQRGDAADVQLVVEAVPENLELKTAVLRDLDRIARDAILASNTS